MNGEGKPILWDDFAEGNFGDFSGEGTDEDKKVFCPLVRGYEMIMAGVLEILALVA